jgi:hypothetical protein
MRYTFTPRFGSPAGRAETPRTSSDRVLHGEHHLAPSSHLKAVLHKRVHSDARCSDLALDAEAKLSCASALHSRVPGGLRACRPGITLLYAKAVPRLTKRGSPCPCKRFRLPSHAVLSHNGATMVAPRATPGASPASSTGSSYRSTRWTLSPHRRRAPARAPTAGPDLCQPRGVSGRPAHPAEVRPAGQRKAVLRRTHRPLCWHFGEHVTLQAGWMVAITQSTKASKVISAVRDSSVLSC